MKLLTLGALVALFSTSAMGVTSGPCPDLTGTYTCTSKSAVPTPMGIAQRTAKGVTIYTLTDSHGSSDVPADNIDYPFDDQGNRTTGTLRFNCENGAFKMLSKGQQRDASNSLISSWDLTQSLILDTDRNLSQTTTGTVSQSGKVSPVREISVCLRRP